MASSDSIWTIATACDAWLDAAGFRETKVLGQLCAAWGGVVGVDVATHAHPVGLSSGELVIAADHPSWATQLSFLGPEILSVLERQVGEPVASRLRVTIRAHEDLD